MLGLHVDHAAIVAVRLLPATFALAPPASEVIDGSTEEGLKVLDCADPLLLPCARLAPPPAGFLYGQRMGLAVHADTFKRSVHGAGNVWTAIACDHAMPIASRFQLFNTAGADT